MKRRTDNRMVATFATIFASAFFTVPFVAHYMKKENLNSADRALNATQVRRGVYLNSGSKDVGLDKDWDFRTNTWQGRRSS